MVDGGEPRSASKRSETGRFNRKEHKEQMNADVREDEGGEC